jgi:ATP-dependent Lhr-like helicase
MNPEADEALIGQLAPPVAAWWRSRFAALSHPQRLAIPAIAAGRNILVCAPTGTGKTLCAFLHILSDLAARAAEGRLEDHIDTVYISPLRALGTDITKNLLTPLSEIFPPLSACAATVSPIRVAQRTGDTPPKERAAIARRPPHILVTTPESLAICLANPTMRDHLRHTRRIIVDELHSLVPNKRGTDLALSVERLGHLVLTSGNPGPQRIGLSATIAPLERMAEFLVGSPAAGRQCAIADASFHRPLDLSIASPYGASTSPFLTTTAINRHVYEFLEQTIRTHRTTLIFTNVRSATERVTFALRKRFAAALDAGRSATADPRDIVHPAHIEAHHSSLDRDVRLDIERRLKAGELRAVVCSTSLELGIDIGTIDRVVLLNSPKGVARGLQRVGRSGHSLDATACGTFLPTVPADLLESLVTADAMRKRQIDAIDFPRGPLDVLAQHLIGMTLQAEPDGIHTDDAFDLIRRTAPYADLPREQFDDVLRYLATHDPQDAAQVNAKLWLEPAGLEAAEEAGAEAPGASPGGLPMRLDGHLFPLRKSTAALYVQNVGTITQEGQVKVKLAHTDGPDGRAATIGTIEEAFAQVLKPNDRFVLGGRCVQFLRSKGMTIEVAECSGQAPTIPRWYSGTMSMEPGLTARMREFRARVRAIAPAGQAAIARMLMRQYSVGEQVAKPAAAYLHAQFCYADIPSDDQLLVERVPDENGGSSGEPATVLVFHTMIGRAANEALARTVAYRLHGRFSLPASRRPPHGLHDSPTGTAVVVDDYAFGIWIESSTAARRADRTLVRSLLSTARFDEDLEAAVEASELFRTQFRYTAIRAHALLQNKFGRRRYIGQMQGYASRLHDALRQTRPGHLLLAETRRTVLDDLLCAASAKRYLETVGSQHMRLLDLSAPSPFAFGLFAAGAARRDTLQLADTADFLLAMYQQVQRRLAAETPEECMAQAPLFS